MQRTSQAIEQEIERQRELLGVHRSNLHQLRLREAKHGLEPPLSVINQIVDIEQQIDLVEKAIERLEQEAIDVVRTEALSPDERRWFDAVKEQRSQSEGITTTRPLALAICLIPSLRSIKADVEGYLGNKGLSMPVEELIMPGLNDVNDIALLVVGLRRKKQAIQDAGYTELHLFIAGPIMAGVVVGGLFDNWKPIKLYHKTNNTPSQSYEYWMPLIGT